MNYFNYYYFFEGLIIKVFLALFEDIVQVSFTTKFLLQKKKIVTNSATTSKPHAIWILCSTTGPSPNMIGPLIIFNFCRMYILYFIMFIFFVFIHNLCFVADNMLHQSYSLYNLYYKDTIYIHRHKLNKILVNHLNAYNKYTYICFY